MSPDPAFGVHCEQRPNAVVVVVSGELDLDSVDVLRRALNSPEARAATVVLDLRRVTFIDSSGLSVVVGQHQRAIAAECRFSVAVGGAPAVQRLFDLSGLRDVIALVEDPDAALAA
jgi:stage II sporulation protein AA (anti-sigma F factor antagonist)